MGNYLCELPPRPHTLMLLLLHSNEPYILWFQNISRLIVFEWLIVNGWWFKRLF